MTGCCSLCKGTGYSGDPETGGRCWDCRGTGCAHPEPLCKMPSEFPPPLIVKWTRNQTVATIPLIEQLRSWADYLEGTYQHGP